MKTTPELIQKAKDWLKDGGYPPDSKLLKDSPIPSWMAEFATEQCALQNVVGSCSVAFDVIADTKAMYPTDIFKENSGSLDAKSAKTVRHTCDLIVGEIKNRLEEEKA